MQNQYIDRNVCTLTDSYKLGHYPMYPSNTEKVYSYFEARKGAKFNKTVFFGLQAILLKNFVGQVIDLEKMVIGRDIVDRHIGPGVFNTEGWNYIIKEHDGRLPLRIRAVPEGTPVPVDNVMMTVENTDPNCWWLTNFLETVLTHVWAPSTVATLSREVKILMKHYLDETSDIGDIALPFMLHDFGFRGVSSVESAGLEGAGHLVNFKGTDTVRALETAMAYYDAEMPAFSVLATEHSIMTSRGKEGEYQVLEDLVNTYREGILSVVIDSYNDERFILEYAKNLKDRIVSRKPSETAPGKVVFRPDSGDPVATTIRILECIENVFGSEINSKGYKCLNPSVGILWGDGIDYQGIRSILFTMKQQGWAADNIVFGMGGGLHQKINRDTQRFAFKASAQKRDGEWYDIHKMPKDRTKASKKGRLALVHDDVYGFKTISNPKGNEGDVLQTVFENGELVREYTFDDVIANAAL